MVAATESQLEFVTHPNHPSLPGYNSVAVVTDIRTVMMADDADDLLVMYRQLLPILGINFDSEVT